MCQCIRLLTSSELADLLRVSPKTLSRWAKRGLLPSAVLPGGTEGDLRWRHADIVAWLDELGAERARTPNLDAAEILLATAASDTEALLHTIQQADAAAHGENAQMLRQADPYDRAKYRK